jgi:hypothetical protein
MKKKYTPKLKYYHIFLFAIILCPIIILNSNKVNRKRQEQKEQKFLEQLYLRKLDFVSDTNEICKKGSEDLQEYYATGDSEKIGIDDKKIENENKGKHIDALVNIISSEGDTSSNLMDYGMHLIPVLVFFVITILSLPGWLICCICNCGNCCCCCCCKKNGCRLPFFIITSAIYALVLGICIYGLSQSNSIFVGFADTECSILKLINEFIEGESKDVTPKWPGMSGIKSIFSDTRTQIGELTHDTYTDLVNNKNGVKTSKENFENLLDSESGNIYNDNYHIQNLDISDDSKDGDYKLDIVYLFGKFTKATEHSEAEFTPNTLSEWWYKEYIETANQAEQFMDTISQNYGELQSRQTDAQNSLKNIEDSISEMENTINDIKDQVSGAIFDYGNLIEVYGKLGFKVVFSTLMVIDIAIAAFMTLLLFFSSSCAKCCCCCRCLFKSLIHILWNLLALLTFFVLLLGTIFTLIGTIGQDLTSVVSFLVSDENLNKENSVLIEGDSKKYMKECINGKGNVKEVIDGVNLNQLNNIDELKTAEAKIIEAEKEANKLKEGKFAYNKYLTLFEDRTEYKIDDFDLVSGSNKINFKETLNKISRLVSNEKWSISCGGSRDECDSLRSKGDDDQYCIEPSSCSAKKPTDWYSDNSFSNDIKDSASILDAFIISIKKELDTSDGKKSIKKALSTLLPAYETFLTTETSSLGTYKNSISRLTSIFNKFAGEEGDAFSIINCKFVGRNVKVILKYLKNSLGKSFYTVGVCLLTSGVGMLVSISLTILLNAILNSNTGK